MSQPRSPSERLLDAELLMESLCARLESGETVDFEALVRAHADLEPELRALHAAGAEIEGALAAGRQEHAAEIARVGRMLAQLGAPQGNRERYVLEGEIGKGGMGVVYRVRDTMLARPLAMKVILGRTELTRTGRTPPVSARQLARFVNEAKLTGQLDHPGIVPVHEVGVDPEGSAFFTMKLVQGLTLVEVFDRRAADEPAWSMPRVLDVIQRVCEAVAFAHGRGVIHRDLKPHNVMVGDFGQVYVMDWGLAARIGEPGGERETDAAVDEELSEQVSRTREGNVVGTPAYMSPEQARGEIAAMGPASDVYAIGAMLYQLIAGHAPYTKPGERASGAEILARVVVGSLERLESPSTPPEMIAIAEKAMARDASTRYAGVRELADDLGRFLDGRSVRAFRTGAWVDTKKWVQRNRALSGALATALLVAIGGATGFAWKASEAETNATYAQSQEQVANRRASELSEAVQTAETRREEAEAARSDALSQKQTAEKNAEETKLVAGFQSRMLSELSVDEFGHAMVVEIEKDLRENLTRLGRSAEQIEQAAATVNETLRPSNPTNVAQRVLEKTIFEPAVKTIEREFGDKPLLAATLQTPLAEQLWKVGLLELGERAARSAWLARRTELGDEHVDTLAPVVILALLLQRQGKPAEAETLLRQVVAASRVTLGDEHANTLAAIDNLAWSLRTQGKFFEAEPLHRQALAGFRATLGDEDPHTMSSLHNLGSLLWAQGSLEESEPLLRQSLAGSRNRLGPGHADTLTSILSLAGLLRDRGKLDEAEPLLREALESGRAQLGDWHPTTLNSIKELAILLQEQGQFAEAEPLYREALAGFRGRLGDEHPGALTALNGLASLLKAMGRLSEAEPLARGALVGRSKTLGERHPDTLSSINNLARILHAQGKLPEAEQRYREAFEGQRVALGDKHRDTFASLGNIAMVLCDRGQLSEAEQVYRELLAGQRAQLGETHSDTLTSISNFARLLQRQGRFTDAEPLVREVLAGFRSTLGDDHPSTLTAMHNLGAVLRSVGRLSEAEPLLRETLARHRARLGDIHPGTFASLDTLARVLGAQGRHSEAESLFREALAGRRAKLGDDHPSTLTSIGNLATNLLAQGALSEADSLCREAVAGFRTKLDDAHPSTLGAINNLAVLLQAKGEFGEAAALFREALAGRRASLGADHADTQQALRALISVLEKLHPTEPASGHDVEAAQLRKLLRD